MTSPTASDRCLSSRYTQAARKVVSPSVVSRLVSRWSRSALKAW
jgi:hypothetical protein